MTLDEAKEEIKEFIKPDGSLEHGLQYISWSPADGDDVVLDSTFSIKELMAIAVYIDAINQENALNT